MTIEQLQKNLVSLYGNNAFNEMLSEINVVKQDSNIPFDAKYVAVGLQFVFENSECILKENKDKCSLNLLVRESFGQAAIYKYNVCGGSL